MKLKQPKTDPTLPKSHFACIIHEGYSRYKDELCRLQVHDFRKMLPNFFHKRQKIPNEKLGTIPPQTTAPQTFPRYICIPTKPRFSFPEQTTIQPTPSLSSETAAAAAYIPTAVPIAPREIDTDPPGKIARAPVLGSTPLSPVHCIRVARVHQSIPLSLSPDISFRQILAKLHYNARIALRCSLRSN